MKALVWEAARRMVLREAPSPSPAADEVVVRVECAGICGSELSGYLGHNALRVPPLVMGHEFAGEIVERGKAAPETLAVGTRVTANPLVWCGTCRLCRQGLRQLCRSRQLIGAHRPGAFAEYVAVPSRVVLPLPDDVCARTGALTEPAGVGVRIGNLAGEVAGQPALVVGAGPIGLLALQTLARRGAGPVYIADLDRERLAMGAALGGVALPPKEVEVAVAVREATEGYGVAVSVDAVGSAVTRATCVAATVSGGTLILSGLHEETSAMPAAEIIRREITVRGAFAYTPDDFLAALEGLRQGWLRLDPWIVEAPLAEGGKWFDRLVDGPGAVSKVLLYPGRDGD